jgi:hypothetical protein
MGVAAMLLLGGLMLEAGAQGRRTNRLDQKGNGKIGENTAPIGSKGVVWYATWDTAVAEAKRSGRPIFFMTAAYQCSQIPGVY